MNTFNPLFNDIAKLFETEEAYGAGVSSVIM
jgi:hypothetical protein